jgi:hypothetical protein
MNGNLDEGDLDQDEREEGLLGENDGAFTPAQI